MALNALSRKMDFPAMLREKKDRRMLIAGK
jgi:hypothetical protein